MSEPINLGPELEQVEGMNDVKVTNPVTGEAEYVGIEECVLCSFPVLSTTDACPFCGTEDDHTFDYDAPEFGNNPLLWP